jgi:hypothetical protein
MRLLPVLVLERPALVIPADCAAGALGLYTA